MTSSACQIGKWETKGERPCNCSYKNHDCDIADILPLSVPLELR
jgi:hypothetical protein